MERVTWDTIIVGSGPAGLSAALLLGRCRRRVLVVDAGEPRNRFSPHMHGFLTRDGTPPRDFLRIAREQLQPYGTVVVTDDEVMHVACDESRFTAELRRGARQDAHTLLLATGVVDHLPRVAGIEPLYGTSVHHCPYCDGWEWRDRRLAAYGCGDAKGGGLALMLLQWSDDVVLVSDGPSELSQAMRQRLSARNVDVCEAPIDRLEGEGGLLQRIVLHDGSALVRDALFFNVDQHQRSPLAARLGCRFTDRGGVDTGDHDVTTNVAGLYVAGDATRDVQLVAVAAAEGVKAAFAIHKRLLSMEGLM